MLYSLVHHYQQFRTIPHQNIKEQDILAILVKVYVQIYTICIFFFCFDPSSQGF